MASQGKAKAKPRTPRQHKKTAERNATKHRQRTVEHRRALSGKTHQFKATSRKVHKGFLNQCRAQKKRSTATQGKTRQSQVFKTEHGNARQSTATQGQAKRRAARPGRATNSEARARTAPSNATRTTQSKSSATQSKNKQRRPRNAQRSEETQHKARRMEVSAKRV